MTQRKITRTVEHRLTNKELDKELSGVKFRSKTNQSVFNTIKSQTWFRQYARQSKEAKNRIVKKVRKGILHGKYTYLQTGEENPLQGKEKPTPKQKKAEKIEKNIQEGKKPVGKPGRKKTYKAPTGKEYKVNPTRITDKQYKSLQSEYASEFKMSDL